MNNTNKSTIFYINNKLVFNLGYTLAIIGIMLLLVACEGNAQPETTAEPTTAVPTLSNTALPTSTPLPTDTIEPTSTPTIESTNTAEPTATSLPTATSEPTGTPISNSLSQLLNEPAQFVIESEKILQALETLTLSQTITISSTDFTEVLLSRCYYDLPQVASYCVLFTAPPASDEAAPDTETITLDSTVWIRQGGSNWQEVTLTVEQAQGATVNEILFFPLQFSPYLSNMMIDAQSNLDEIQTYQLSGQLDVVRFLPETLGAGSASFFLMAETQTGTGQLFVSQESGLPLRFEAEMILGTEARKVFIHVVNTYQDFNTPVVIPDPTSP